MKIEYNGLKLDIRFNDSATQCGACEEMGLYEGEPSDISVATKGATDDGPFLEVSE